MLARGVTSAEAHIAAAALKQLRALLRGSGDDAASKLQAIQLEARSRSAGAAYLWLLLAQTQLELEQPLAACRSWHRAVLTGALPFDSGLLAALEIASERDWLALSAHLNKLRSEYLRDAYADLRQALAPRELFRIDRAVAGYLGEAAVFSSHPTQRPKVIFVPGLSGYGFLEPSAHPLVAPLLAQTDAMRSDYDQALACGDGIEPFLGDLGGHTASAYFSGSAAASWDALFFYRHGQRIDANHRRFPRTSAALESLDLCRIDHQAPEICYSILRPHSRIEPHHGVTNARVVIHIPLRIPPGCHLHLTRVGQHHWREGQALVFDDTFEHSAENPSGLPRGILLLDAWHPDLTEVERVAFRAVIEAITRLEAADHLAT